MGYNSITAGKDLPNDINVVIEIAANEMPTVKYEVDKDSGALFVDRFMTTAMAYPANYGYVPQTLADDGDPLDVIVMTPVALLPGVVIKARPIGILNMVDEAGSDAKLIAVPNAKLCKEYAHIQDINDVNETLLNMIEHFFEHYKDLEPEKWVKVDGWSNVDAAKHAIMAAVENYNNVPDSV